MKNAISTWYIEVRISIDTLRTLGYCHTVNKNVITAKKKYFLLRRHWSSSHFSVFNAVDTKKITRCSAENKINVDIFCEMKRRNFNIVGWENWINKKEHSTSRAANLFLFFICNLSERVSYSFFIGHFGSPNVGLCSIHRAIYYQHIWKCSELKCDKKQTTQPAMRRTLQHAQSLSYTHIAKFRSAYHLDISLGQ